MILIEILKFAGGISLFLFGMSVMSSTLADTYKEKAKKLLDRPAINGIRGVLLGTLITAVIQSSSALTVMIVGAVGSGIMNMMTASAVIMGANIGTTVTPWLMSLIGLEGDSLIIALLKPSSLGPIAGIIGIIILMGSKKWRGIAYILLGFCTLLAGLDIMSSVASPLSKNENFIAVLHQFENPIAGVITGILVTAVLQSSSASIGILQILSTTGALSIGGAVPLIIGQNIGTCVTGLIASVSSSTDAKRSAMIHVYFNIFGGAVFGLLFGIFAHSVGIDIVDSDASATSVAVIHTFFNLTATAVLYPLRKWLVYLAIKTFKDKGSVSHKA